MNMKISVFQFDISWLNPQANIAIIEEHLNMVEKGVDLMVLPEMFLTGFCMDPSLSSIDEEGIEVAKLISLAREFNIGIMGSLAIREGGSYYNRVLLLTSEGIVGRYDKQYLYSPSGENDVFDSKYVTNIIEFKGWKILPQVCYDLRFPENVRSLSAPGLLIYMANWPTPRIHHWDALLKARAIENQCFVIGCNRLGEDGNNWEYPGHSTVIKPDGTIIELNKSDKSRIVTIALKEVDEYRSKYRFLEDKKY